VPSDGTGGGKPLCREEAQKAQKKGINYVWLKAAKALADEPVAQILGYLRSSGVEHGLLINFGAPKFEIKKHTLSWIGEASRPGGLIGGTLSLFALQ
jgi:hypothetical protein